MPELRIPPAVSFAFERVAADVCDRASLEPSEWSAKAKELVNHLEQRWCEGAERGMSTEEAQERALTLFGPPEEVGRWLRKGLIRRWLKNPDKHYIRAIGFTYCLFIPLTILAGEHAYGGSKNDHLKDSALQHWSLVSSIALLTTQRLQSDTRFWPRILLSTYSTLQYLFAFPLAVGGIFNLLIINWLAVQQILSGESDWWWARALKPVVVVALFINTKMGVILWTATIASSWRTGNWKVSQGETR